MALALAVVAVLFAIAADGKQKGGQSGSVPPVSQPGGDMLQVGEHVFEFRGVSYNSDGTSTWQYVVTSGRKPALSHWVLEFDPSILGMSNVVSCSEQYEVNTDPTTHVYGLKFDGGYNETRPAA